MSTIYAHNTAHAYTRIKHIYTHIHTHVQYTTNTQHRRHMHAHIWNMHTHKNKKKIDKEALVWSLLACAEAENIKWQGRTWHVSHFAIIDKALLQHSAACLVHLVWGARESRQHVHTGIADPSYGCHEVKPIKRRGVDLATKRKFALLELRIWGVLQNFAC